MQPHVTVVVGAGKMSHGWLQLLHARPELRLVALVDVVLDAARARAAATGLRDVLEAHDDLEEALARHRPSIVVDLAVPSARPHVIATALRHGCHVLTEKPLALDLESATQIAAAARDAGKVVVVSQQRRFTEGFAALQQVVAAGTLGRPLALYLDFFRSESHYGFRSGMEHPVLQDMAVHHFDAIRFVTGEEPVQVYARTAAAPWSQFQGQAIATVHAHMSGGTQVSYRGHWATAGFVTDYNGSWRLVGPHGSALFDGAGLPQVAATSASGLPDAEPPLTVAPDAPVTVDQTRVVDEFLAAVEGRGRASTDVDDNVGTIAFVDAAIRSAASGEVVHLS